MKVRDELCCAPAAQLPKTLNGAKITGLHANRQLWRICHMKVFRRTKNIFVMVLFTAGMNVLAAGMKGLEAWRLGAESNRCTRLCRPLHDHSAT
jgi:hypothetical protein